LGQPLLTVRVAQYQVARDAIGRLIKIADRDGVTIFELNDQIVATTFQGRNGFSVQLEANDTWCSQGDRIDGRIDGRTGQLSDNFGCHLQYLPNICRYRPRVRKLVETQGHMTK
jgi:hypothetical protein